MMNRIAIVILAAYVSTLSLRADELKPQASCPIDGLTISKAFYVDSSGLRLYACSANCLEKVTADVTGAIASVKDKGEQPELRQTLCPVMESKKIKDSLFVDHDGKRIHVCCRGCLKKVTKDPQTYMAKLEAQGITLDKYQVFCPVTPSNAISDTLFLDSDGKRLHLCSEACLAEAQKDPAKYISQVEADGITLDKAD